MLSVVAVVAVVVLIKDVVIPDMRDGFALKQQPAPPAPVAAELRP